MKTITGTLFLIQTISLVASGKKQHVRKEGKVKVGAVKDGTCSTSACVQVSNNCGVTLYLDRTNVDDDGSGTVSYVTELDSGNSLVLDISGWMGMTGQRLYAWWSNPIATSGLDETKYADKVEINICETDPVTFCYNPTAVDYFALPVQIGPVNSSDCSDVPQTGTPNFVLANVKSQCPTVYDSADPLGTCISPYEACTADSSLSICTALDSAVQRCIDEGVCSSGTTTVGMYFFFVAVYVTL